MTWLQLRFVSLTLLIIGCGYENAVPFAHPDDAAPATPDAAAPAAEVALPDAPASLDLVADPPAPMDLAIDEASDNASPGDAAAGEAGAGCASCYAEARGAAMPGSSCGAATANGCDDIPAGGLMSGDAGDRALCQALDNCMKTTGCWKGGAAVLFCFCGTASSLDCVTGKANGACKAEVMAATKAPTDMRANQLMSNTAFPAGFATQKYACYRMSCSNACTN